MKPVKLPESGQKPGVLMGIFGSIGFTLVAATFAGFALGLWLDNRMGTSPWFMIALLLAGFLAALINIFFKVSDQTGKKR